MNHIEDFLSFADRNELYCVDPFTVIDHHIVYVIVFLDDESHRFEHRLLSGSESVDPTQIVALLLVLQTVIE